MKQLELMYRARCEQISDINEHLPTLRAYAAQSPRICEFGIRYGNSTAALLAAEPKIYTGYDLTITPQALSVVQQANSKTTTKLNVADTKRVRVDRCDLLFIDTFHSHNQCIAELMNNYRQVGQFIILHDTETFGMVGEDGTRGLNFAVDEFLAQADAWELYEHYPNNNGLTILRRKRVNDD